MARTPSSDNPCPQEEFIRQFAKMLDVTQDVASHIYETFTVTCIFRRFFECYIKLKSVKFSSTSWVFSNPIRC